MPKQKADNGLRPIFHKKLSGHWTAVESPFTGRGIPDSNFCIEGHEGWVEFKSCTGNAVGVDPLQVAWSERRWRAGGRVLLAVRLAHSGGTRLGSPVDQLWLYDKPGDFRSVITIGLRTPPAAVFTGGPSAWDWAVVANILKGVSFSA